MQSKTPALLWDMLDSARALREWTQGVSLDEYERDEMLRSAVERRFEIIGEAARRLTQHDPATAATLPDVPRIIAFRNVIAHGYDEIDNARVWEVIQVFLPELTSQVEVMLAEHGGPLP